MGIGPKSELIARGVQEAVAKIGTEASYLVGNATQEAVTHASSITKLGKGAVALQCGHSLGSTAYKAAEDLARNDKICAGVCLCASFCEVLSATSAIVSYPGSYTVIVAAKTVSLACIRFRDLCRNTAGELQIC